MKKRRGLFITLEGPEGSGKSTHARLLAAQLQAAGYSVLTTREPGGTPAGEKIRHLLQHDDDTSLCSEAELLLFLASRAQLVREIIQPALNRGMYVICDRFADSTLAYQGYGRGCPLELLIRMNAWATQGLEPDITLLLDLDVHVGFKRLQRRNAKNRAVKDRIEREALAFHERVRAGYLELARRWPARFRVISAARSVTRVQTDLWNLTRGQIERILKTSSGRSAAQR